MLDKQSKQKFEKLRQVAEDMLRQEKTSSLDVPDDLAELVHELEVHQIELELQHRELSVAYGELEKARQVYADLFDFAPLGYVISNETGEILKVNLTFATMLGRDRSTLLQQNFASLIDAEYRDLHYVHQRLLFRTRKRQSYTLYIKSPNITGFHARLTSDFVDDGSGTVRTSITDVSKEKEAEEVLKRALRHEKDLSDIKTRLLTLIAHEMRTPLTVIMTSVEMLNRYSDQISGPKRKQRFDTIRNYLWYLNDLIDDVVIAHQASTDGLIPRPEQFDLLPFMRQLVQDIDGLEAESRIQLRIITSQQAELVMWDQKLFRRIMVNLLQNALKYSEAEVFCTVACQSETVTITVEDRGIGIPDKDRPHVFEMFYRGSNTDATFGTGVGLGIANLAVKAHNGAIDFNSHDGGSSFFVTLPRDLKAPNPPFTCLSE